MLVAPHTSNWDFVHLMFFSFLVEVKVSWFGKHTIFKWPFGRLFRYLGGVPVDRSKHHSFVEKMIKEFEKRDKFILALSPEGTRKPVKNWKSGFYFIAKTLNLPVVLLGLDYKEKTINFLFPIYFDEKTSKEEAIGTVKKLFSRFNAKYPEKFIC
ncbi:1-acyl-sn-glycerol-3-phosphate acyltransferase [Thermotomaculum hydrothermale]|uniref:1-acyl-sn-glycerol-3-phosphate acyltransferase n=1 Tax=Thermotomaculum hydrothermale TaxID=981385 RepID=UPI0019161A05